MCKYVYLFVFVSKQHLWQWHLNFQVQLQLQPLHPHPPFLMSLFHLLNSGTSMSSNTDTISTPVTVWSGTQSGSILHCCRDSNDFKYSLNEIITRPAGTLPITPGTTKHLKTSCNDVACHYDMNADDLKCFSEVCMILSLSCTINLHLQAPSILHMLLDLKAHTLKVEKDLKKKQAEDLLDLLEFKVHATILTGAIRDCFTRTAFYCCDVTQYPCIVQRL